MARLKPPILWTYTASSYIHYLLVSLFGILAIILSTKLEEVAKFIALGASTSRILLFILYLIPYTLQLAIPLSSAIAAYVVFYQMQQSGELTAARSCGYSLKLILYPISIISILLGILTMWGIFDLSAKSRLAAKKLEFDVRNEEPLAFIQTSRFLSNHGVAAELQGSLKAGERVSDLLICFASPTTNRLNLLLLKRGFTEKNALIGNNMSIISSKAPESSDQHVGTLIIENADKKKTPTNFIHELSAKHKWKVDAEQFPLNVVLATKHELSEDITSSKYQGISARKSEKIIGKFTSEPFRRISLSLAIFTLCSFTAVCGMRHNKRKVEFINKLLPLFGFLFFILCYLGGKNCNTHALAAVLLYLLPHPILLFAAKKMQTSLEYGHA